MTRIKFLAVFSGIVGILVLATLFSAVALSQVEYVPQVSLSVTDTVPVEAMAANSVLFPIRSDAKGNVYFQFFQAVNGLSVPVVRVSADGEKTAAFSLASAPGFAVDINGFAVAPDGAVYLAAWGRGPNQKTKLGQGYILSFTADGELDSTVAMASRDPFQIGIFQDGNLLVSGVKDVHLYGADRPPVSVPFTEIIDSGGQLVKEIKLPNDINPAKPSDTDFQKEEAEVPSAISRGDVVTGADGYVYLLRHTAEPRIYVIGSEGSIVRTLDLKLPRGTQSWGALQYDPINGGELALFLDVKDPQETPPSARVISLFDAQSGERLVDYIAPPEVGAALASCSANGFTFLGATSQHQMALKRVNPD